MATEDFGFAPPPFDAAAALLRVQRELRALGLTERAGSFERRSIAIARVAVEGAALKASLVKRPSRNSPEWQHRHLASHADVSQFCTSVKRQLATWNNSDD